jgi:CHAT domain-containing protein/tetratricopeptide (TPR) repeat protein
MLARSLLFIFFLFSAVISLAQGTSQLWKVYYDSGNLYLKSDVTRAIRLFAKAESVAKNDLGIYHDNYLAIIGALGIANENARNYQQAQKYLSQAVTFGKEVYGDDDPKMLQAQYNLGLFYGKTNNIGEASKLFTKIFHASEKSRDRNFYALSGTQLVNISERRHQLDSALVIAHKVIGSNLLKDYESISYDIQLLEGRILRKLKKYDEAQVALMSLQKKLISRGSAFRTLTRSANVQISLLDIDLGRYSKAEKELLQQYRLAKGDGNTEPALMPEITNAIAFVYEKLGVYDKAIVYYQEALGCCADGNNIGTCDAIENNIAGMYLKLREYDKAIEKYRSYTDSRKDNSRFDDPDFLATLNNLATALRQNGQAEEALQYFNQIYTSLEQNNKTNEDFAATVLNNIGVAQTLLGRSDEATINFQKALKIKESFYGSDSPLLLDLCGNLAVSLWAAGNKKEALPYFEKSLQLGLREVRYNFQNLTEAEQLQFYAQQKENFERFNTFAVQSGNEMPGMLIQMFNNQVFLKSLAFFTNRKATAAVKDLNNPKLTSTLQLKQLKSTQLGNFYQSTLDELKLKGISLSKLENEIDSLDKIIRHQLANRASDHDHITWNDIQKAIPNDEVSIDIIRFRKYDLMWNKKNSVNIGFTDSIYYAALITTTETRNNPDLVLLKNGQQMETRLFNYYRNTTKFDVDDTISIKTYWAPIGNKIKNKKKIHFTPDGIYRQVNLNTIRDRQGKYNIEKYEIRSSLNPVGLITKGPEKPADLSKLVLMGNAIFGIDQAKVGANSIQSQFTNLPGTQEEIAEIAKVMKTIPVQFVKAEASEQNLRKLKSPGVLHIATHGYFSVDVSYLNEQVKSDYLFHSGLLLSAGKTDSNPTENDGIVTAYDIINLDLAKTDLVVLSACETGVGKNEFGEGVHGLQRSFMLAGAKDLVISLWRVDDRVTKDLMIKFYQNLLLKKSPNEALRLAQLEIMKREPNRRNWGSFITVGSN